MASARYSGEVERKWTTRREEEGRKDEGEDRPLRPFPRISWGEGGWIRAGGRFEKFRVCSREGCDSGVPLLKAAGIPKYRRPPFQNSRRD